jgi:hypothetical protein
MSVGPFRFGHARESSRVTGSLLSVGLRSMAAAMAASAIALAFTVGGTPASSSDPGSPGRLIASAFEAIYSQTGEDRAPVSSQIPAVRLASLETDFMTRAASAANEGQTTSAMAATDRVFFDERFNSSFGERFTSFDARFGVAADDDPELMPRATQGASRLPAAELGRDSLARLETPKRQNARLAMLTPPANAPAVTQPSVGAAPNKPMRPADAPSETTSPEPANRTAVYDISARVVYLPNGEKLEAHSGLGEHMDDPRSISVKNRGATPPNVYELSLREQLFHGVRAIRLTPVERDKMFGRDGILAHSYLLGPNGASNGCVSISDYPKFLNAFLNGEIDRLVVVERLADPPQAKTSIGWISERLKALFKSS